MTNIFQGIRVYQTVTIEFEESNGKTNKISGKIIILNKQKGLITISSDGQKFSLYDWEIIKIEESQEVQNVPR